MKKILRGPIIYILLAIVAVWIGSSLITALGIPREVSTQRASSSSTTARSRP